MNNNILTRNRRLALTGAFSALVIVLVVTNFGIIPIGTVASITILQIPVILICMLGGLPDGLVVGAIFGISSLIRAAVCPSGAIDPLFVYPWNSVLPRMLLAVVAWGVWNLLNKIPHMPKIVSAGLTGFIATVAHTLMVIGCIYLFNGNAVREIMQTGYWALIAALGFNATLEALASTIICVAVYTGLFISSKKQSKLSKQ